MEGSYQAGRFHPSPADRRREAAAEGVAEGDGLDRGHSRGDPHQALDRPRGSDGNLLRRGFPRTPGCTKYP